MAKKTKRIITAIICVLVIAGGVFLMISILGGMKYAKDELRSCSVSTGGGMLGGYSNSTLRLEKDGSVTLTVEGKETHADRLKTTVYQVSPEALDHVRDLVNQYDLYRASKRPKSGLEVMDGDTTTLSFTYSKGYFRIEDDQILTKKMSEGWREAIRYLSSLASGEGVTTLEPQTAMLYLKSGYTLQYLVEDTFDGRLDEILSEEREVTRAGEYGMILCEGVEVDLSGAEAVTEAAAGTMIYDEESGSVILLYEDYAPEKPVYILAELDGYVSSACPLIAEME
ncbi:MAG: hypothetical protein IKE37_01175, partial [Firmicutes bacterium]|nr:hypothetical protein [Bacillota bacterium]